MQTSNQKAKLRLLRMIHNKSARQQARALPKLQNDPKNLVHNKKNVTWLNKKYQVLNKFSTNLDFFFCWIIPAVSILIVSYSVLIFFRNETETLSGWKIWGFVLHFCFCRNARKWEREICRNVSVLIPIGSIRRIYPQYQQRRTTEANPPRWNLWAYHHMYRFWNGNFGATWTVVGKKMEHRCQLPQSIPFILQPVLWIVTL